MLIALVTAQRVQSLHLLYTASMAQQDNNIIITNWYYQTE